MERNVKSFSEKFKNGKQISIHKEIKTYSNKARLFTLRSQEINGYKAKKGTELWIPNSKILSESIRGGENDNVLVEYQFYKSLVFV